jgi:predicted 2-oxoglutarate/Fe(II)-dependent dioxygenase YbiX
MYNPYNIPKEYIFEYKEECSYPIVVITIPEIETETDNLRVVAGLAPDDGPTPALPNSMRCSNDTILATTNIFPMLVDRACSEIYNHWKINGKLEMALWAFQKYPAGVYFTKHFDSGKMIGSIPNFMVPERKFTAVFYLDTCGQDYTGGEFVIHPDIGGPVMPITIAPKKCQMVIFPSSPYFFHEVNRIKTGERIVLTIFIDVKDNV